MVNIDSLIFDLDGTLWDASSASAVGWNQGIQALGLSGPELSNTDIQKVTGRPFDECVRLLLGPDPARPWNQILETLDQFERGAISERGGRLYPEVAEVIPLLAQRRPLFIVSNCQEWYLECFLAKSGLRQYFRECDCYGRTGLPKSETLLGLIQRQALSQAVYIGDTTGDRSAALAAGVPFWHAGYGFEQNVPAEQTLAAFSDLQRLLSRSG